MYRLIEFIKQTGAENESQAIYPYEDYTEAKGEFETRIGAYLKSDSYESFTIMILDNIGNITGEKEADIYHKGAALSPRLIEVKTTDIEEPNISKYDTEELVEANYHSKLGSAIKNYNVKSEMLRGIDGFGGVLNYIYWVRPVEIESEE